MPDVGIMTWFQHRNYGSALQAAALSEIIKKIGFSPMIIKYHYSKVNPIDKKQKLQFFIYKAADHIKYMGKQTYHSEERESKFKEFLLQNLSFTDECATTTELEALNDKFSCFVCGSDQIWGTTYFKPHYFLDFVSDDRKKIAYAPSIGTPRIDNKKIEKEMKRLCSSFAYLSTREEAGSKIIHDLTGRDVKTVLDPTLLLYDNDWTPFICDDDLLSNKPYVIVYMLGCNESHWKIIYDIADKFGLDVRIVPVYKNDFGRKGCITYPIGPAEFLALIKNADYVCTDSFHGMAFSINFKKQFTIFERFKKHDRFNQNSRIYNLADKLGLNDRIYRISSDTKMIYAEIDYKRVDEKRKKLVDDSVGYLKTALNNVTGTQDHESN